MTDTQKEESSGDSDESTTVEYPASEEMNPELDTLMNIEGQLKELTKKQEIYKTEDGRRGTYDLATHQKGGEIANAIRNQNKILKKLLETLQAEEA